MIAVLTEVSTAGKECNMGKFDGILLCTDLDGTLIRNDRTVSAENRQAIEYFKSEGGCFTFITGRMPFFVGDIYEVARPNVAIGCVNGGGVYDYEAQTYLWQREVPRGFEDLLSAVEEAVPTIGMQVNTFYNTYFCKENAVMAAFREITKVPNLVRGYREITEPVAKLLFGGDIDELEQVATVVNRHPFALQIDLIRTEQYLLDIVPRGIGKGTALAELVRLLGDRAQHTVAVGDYNNDISMLEVAQVGIAVANACPAAKEAADRLTVSNDEHAIAQIVEDLGRHAYGF